MIGRLTGLVVEQGDDGVTTLDVNGVGYEVTLPLGALGRARKDEQGRTLLHVHTVVREDAFLLYGFPSLEERDVFRIILSISGVGPKTACAILGAMPVPELASAIARKELTRLTSISGVGKKTAERLLLELKDKLGAITLGGFVPAPAQPKAAPVNKAELLRSALANMGFRPLEVDRAIESVRERIAAAELADLVREALAVIGR